LPHKPPFYFFKNIKKGRKSYYLAFSEEMLRVKLEERGWYGLEEIPEAEKPPGEIRTFFQNECLLEKVVFQKTGHR